MAAAKGKAPLGAVAGDALVSIGFLRDFALPDSQRSLSYRITVGSLNRTLSLEEIGAIRSRIIDGMQSAGYELRV